MSKTKRKRDEKEVSTLERSTPQALLFDKLYTMFDEFGIATVLVSIVLDCLRHADMSHHALERHFSQIEDDAEQIETRLDDVREEINDYENISRLIDKTSRRYEADVVRSLFTDNSAKYVQQLETEWDELEERRDQMLSDDGEEERINQFWTISAYLALPLHAYRLFGLSVAMVGHPCRVQRRVVSVADFSGPSYVAQYEINIGAITFTTSNFNDTLPTMKLLGSPRLSGWLFHGIDLGCCDSAITSLKNELDDWYEPDETWDRMTSDGYTIDEIVLCMVLQSGKLADWDNSPDNMVSEYKQSVASCVF